MKGRVTVDFLPMQVVFALWMREVKDRLMASIARLFTNEENMVSFIIQDEKRLVVVVGGAIAIEPMIHTATQYGVTYCSVQYFPPLQEGPARIPGDQLVPVTRSFGIKERWLDSVYPHFFLDRQD
jgi:hypothetical protein